MTRFVDALILGWSGIASRPGRAVMSALGIALGIATLVLVTTIPASGQAELDQQLTELGSDVLVAQPTSATRDRPMKLHPGAAAMVRRIGPVTSASALANLNLPVVRHDYADPNLTAGISALAATPDLLDAVHASMRAGSFLTDVTAGLPAVVLGHDAANWLGITDVDPLHPRRVKVGNAWLTVVGVLAPTPLTPELEQTALVGWDAARDSLGFDGRPTVVYLRADERQVEGVRQVLPATLDPELPGLIQVSRPSDVLAAKRASHTTFAGLFLGLAGVALVVGGLGVANTMVVSVLERRREIGLRRALGATRRDIRRQFLTEAILLSLLGGAGGTVVGVAGSVGYALVRGWPVVLPLPAVVAGVLGAIVVGAVAGLHPAVRASRLAPTVALATA